MAPALTNDQSFVIKLVEADGLRLQYFDWRWKSDERSGTDGGAAEWKCTVLRFSGTEKNKDVVTAAVMQDGMRFNTLWDLKIQRGNGGGNADVSTEHASVHFKVILRSSICAMEEFTDCMESRDKIPQSPPSDPLCPHTRL